MTILLLTFEEDVHYHRIQKELDQLQADYVRYSYTDYPAHSEWVYHCDGVSFDTTLKTQNRLLQQKNIGSIWYRRPGKPLAQHIHDQGMKHYIENESAVMLNTLPYLIDQAYWFPYPPSEAAADLKPRQLKVAQEVGLIIPKTFIGNCKEVASHYLDNLTLEQEWIIKPLRVSYIDMELNFWDKIKKQIYYLRNKEALNTYQNIPQLKDYVTYTSRIDVKVRKILKEEKFSILNAIPSCPVIIQEYVKKAFELRVTVVEDHVFACKIDSQSGDEETRLDWRNDPYSVSHTPYKLPEDTREKILSLLHRLNLNFACIDMVVTPNGEHVFLEVNPNGQWLWIEDLSELPIARTIAKTLVRHDHQ